MLLISVLLRALVSTWHAEQWAAFGAVAQAAITAIAVIVAGLAARSAYHQVDEARKTREEQARLAQQQSLAIAQRDQQRRIDQDEQEERRRQERARPYVVVDFAPNNTSPLIFDLVVENVGQTLAKNVRITFDPPLESSLDSDDGYNLADSTLLKEGIPSIPPGKRIEAIFDQGDYRKKAGLPLAYEVRVELDDYQGRPQETLEYKLDLAFLYGLTYIEQKTVHDVAKTLKKIQEDVHRWTQHQSGLRVWVRDEHAYQRAVAHRSAQRLRERRERQERSSVPDDQIASSDEAPSEDVLPD